MTLLVRSSAKINLALEVLGKREDGFHNINSIFTTVGIYDEIEISPNPENKDICLVQGNKILASEQNNICTRAVLELRRYVQNSYLLKGENNQPERRARDWKSQDGVKILLKKNIPIGAGMGGGSSNAASVILALNEMWNLELSKQELRKIAANLGSDVPFFLQGKTAIAKSRGEELLHLDIGFSCFALVINIGIHISTPWAYNKLNRAITVEATDLQAALNKALSDSRYYKELFVNHFEEPIFNEYKILENVKNELYIRGAFFALMSGSGSTIFGLFENKEAAEEAKIYFRKKYSDCFAEVANIGH